MDSKSRLQLLAPPPLTGLPTSDGNSPTSGDNIVSPELSNTENLLCDSSLVGSRWFAHSNGLDALLSSKSITYNNDPFRFDDDLPSLFAKQVSKFPTSSMVGKSQLYNLHCLKFFKLMNIFINRDLQNILTSSSDMRWIFRHFQR